MIRTAKANWQGDGMTGQGGLTMQSGVFQNQPYSFNTRFASEDGKAGTNPEELIAAAHAGCFTMALSFALSGAGFKVASLETTASVDMQKDGGGFAIKGIALNLQAKVPEITPEKFNEIANGAKVNCPISKALAAVPITLNATLN